MKISLNWIKDYTPIILTPADLMERVSVSLTEVSSIEMFGEQFKGVTVAEVVGVEAHPTSKDLLVLKVNTGTNEVQVVVQNCDVKAGDKVAYFKPGLTFTSGDGSKEMKIEKRKIKGVESEGFIPSGREIGLNYDHTTVYKLSSDAKIGEEVAVVLDLYDEILEIKNKSLTHRPDTFSVVGMAREIAAIQKTKFTPPTWLVKPETIKPTSVSKKLKLRVDNKAEALCRRYMAVVIDNVKVKPSPLGMQIRLSKLGIRPINNIVDISNYLMLEAGQPNHAFDYDKVIAKDPSFKDEAVITIRLAEAGEKITTIDGQTKELYPDTIVIADSKNPIGIAGVMGGKDTEISDETKRVIFQVENLDMYSIRRTSMKLGLFTDAVTRFSKGIDPNLCEPVLYRGLQLIAELAGGEIVSAIIDDYSDPLTSHVLDVNTNEIRQNLGVDISDEEIVDILERLGIEVREEVNDLLVLTIPTFRHDLQIPEDIYEEVARIYGYDKVVPTLPARTITPTPANRSRDRRLKIKQTLKEYGGNELYTYSFVGKNLYEGLGLSVANCYKLKNPISPDLGYMRPLIVPSLLEKVPQNVRIKPDLAFFEIDLVDPCEKNKLKKGELPLEFWHLGLVHSMSYYDAKLYLDSLLAVLGVKDYSLLSLEKHTPADIPAWVKFSEGLYNPGRYALISVDKKIVGVIGQIGHNGVESLELPHEISAFELNLSELEPFISEMHDYREPSKFPAVTHDLCFIVNSDVLYQSLYDAVKSSDKEGSIVRNIVCKDIYQDPKKPEERKITLSITMQSNEKTLSDKDIDQVRNAIVKSAKEDVGAELCK